MRNQFPWPLRNHRLLRKEALKRGMILEGPLEKRMMAEEDALRWLRTIAKKLGPERKHVRRILQLIHDLDETSWDFYAEVNDVAKVLFRVRDIDVMSMGAAIKLFCTDFYVTATHSSLDCTAPMWRRD